MPGSLATDGVQPWFFCAPFLKTTIQVSQAPLFVLESDDTHDWSAHSVEEGLDPAPPRAFRRKKACGGVLRKNHQSLPSDHHHRNLSPKISPNRPTPQKNQHAMCADYTCVFVCVCLCMCIWKCVGKMINIQQLQAKLWRRHVQY